MRSRRSKNSCACRRQLLNRHLQMQPLDQRMLLAADTTLVIDGPHSAALIAGLDQLDHFGDRLGLAAPLMTFVPMATSTEPGSSEAADSGTEVRIGKQLDIGSILSTAISVPATTYLESSLHPTATGLANAIRQAAFGITPNNSSNLSIEDLDVQDQSAGDTRQFAISFVAKRSQDMEIDFARQLSDAAATIEGSFTAPLDLEFGFDATISSTRDADGNAQASVLFGDANYVHAVVDHAQDESLAGQLGFLGFEVSDGSIDFDFHVGLDYADQPTIGFTPTELISTSLEQMVAFDTTGKNEFAVTLPMIVQSAGLDLGDNPTLDEQPRIEIRDTNLFDGEFDYQDPFFRLINADQLVDFKTVTAVGIYSALQTVQEVFASVQQNDVFQKEIPFTGGKTLADVLDVAAALSENVTGPLGLSAANTSEDANVTAAGNDDPAFQNIQELVSLLASKIHYSADDDGDSATHDPVIKFDVDFHHLFDVATFDAAFDFDLGEINAIETDSTIEVEAELDAKFQIGLLLRRPEGGLPLTRGTRLGDLNGGDGVDLADGTIDLSLRDGRLIQVDLSALTAENSLGDLIDAVEMQTAAGPFRFARFDRGGEAGDRRRSDFPVHS